MIKVFETHTNFIESRVGREGCGRQRATMSWRVWNQCQQGKIHKWAYYNIEYLIF